MRRVHASLMQKYQSVGITFQWVNRTRSCRLGFHLQKTGSLTWKRHQDRVDPTIFLLSGLARELYESVVFHFSFLTLFFISSFSISLLSGWVLRERERPRSRVVRRRQSRKIREQSEGEIVEHNLCRDRKDFLLSDCIKFFFFQT